MLKPEAKKNDPRVLNTLIDSMIITMNTDPINFSSFIDILQDGIGRSGWETLSSRVSSESFQVAIEKFNVETASKKRVNCSKSITPASIANTANDPPRINDSKVLNK